MFPSLSPPSTSLLSLPLIPCPSSKGSEERSNHTEEVVITCTRVYYIRVPTCTRVYYIHAAGQWKNKPMFTIHAISWWETNHDGQNMCLASFLFTDFCHTVFFK